MRSMNAVKAVKAVKYTAALAVLLSAMCAACASSPALRAADSGDRAALTTAVAEREKRGDLGNGEAASLARTVASRDLRAARSAKAPDALARVEDVRACARELASPLEDLMATHDEAGAAAALALLDAGELSQDDARQFATDPVAPWRAVGARALVRSEDRNQRLQALLDPDPRVRRQAVRALVDLEPLPAGELADVLRDLWPKADEGLREDIAIAWASPRVWSDGGSEALLTLVASGQGPGVVEGAAAILRNGTMGGEVVMEATAQMERAIAQGSRERRQQAIAGAPLERPELLAAVKKASEDGDLQVRVAALSRLAQAKQPGAVDGLVALAGTGSPVAQRARFALASLGDRRVQAWVEQDLQAEGAEARLGAATTLSAMGVAARAAPLLADADAAVRVKAACTILLGARRD